MKGETGTRPGRMFVQNACLIVLLCMSSLALAQPYQYQSSISNPNFFVLPDVALYGESLAVFPDNSAHVVYVCGSDGVCRAQGGPGGEIGQFNGPWGVAVNGSNEVFIADQNNFRVQKCTVQPTGEVEPPYAFDCEVFDTTVQGQGGAQWIARGIDVDSQGQVVMADANNHRIVICPAVGGNCSAYGEQGSGPGQFSEPEDVAVDADGRILVADSGNDRIQVCNLSGQFSCSSFGTPGDEPGQFSRPIGIAALFSGRIAISDYDNRRAQICSYQGSCVEFAKYDFQDPQPGQVNLPFGIEEDIGNPGDPDDDRLLIADNNSVKVFAANPEFRFLPSLTLHKQCDPADDDGRFNLRVDGNVVAVDIACGESSEPIELEAGEHGVDETAGTGTDLADYRIPLFSGDCDADGNVTLADGEVKACTITNRRKDPPTSGFLINAGLNDAWLDFNQGGQGVFVTVFPDIGYVFIAIFTFDVERPPGNIQAILGEPGHRWVTAFGTYSGNMAELDVELTEGGIFNSALPEVTQTPGYGTIKLTFIDCNTLILEYDFPGLGISGEMTLTRLTDDNVALCEVLQPEE